MRDILLLYPGPLDLFRPVEAERMRQLGRLGWRFILASEDALACEPGAWADLVALPPRERIGASWEVLRGYLDRRPVAAVVTQAEAALPLAALAARHLGLPGLPVPGAHACINKHETRRLLAAAGVGQPRFSLVSDALGVRRFARQHGYPVVLKAVASALARLVTRVDGKLEVEAGVARLAAGLERSEDVARLAEFAALAGLDLGCDPRRQFLVESFAAGDPLEVDGLVLGSKPWPFGVIEQVLTVDPPFYMDGYLLPADRSQAELTAIEAFARSAVTALGLADAGFSVELRARGRDLAVIEVNGRLGWDQGLGDLFAALLGVQPSLLAVEVALGGPVRRRPRRGTAALAYGSSFVEGRVVAVPGAADLLALSRPGLALEVDVKPGEVTHAPPHPDFSPHLAHALARHPISSRAAYALGRAAVDRLAIAVEPAVRLADSA